MKKIDNYSNGKIIDSIVLGIISIGIVALDTYYILLGTIEVSRNWIINNKYYKYNKIYT